MAYYMANGPLEIGEVGVVFLGHITTIRLTGTVVLGIDIKTLCIARVSYWGLNWAPVSAVECVIPVCIMEEGVGFHSSRTATDVTQTPRTIDCTKGPNYVLGLL
jgi:hypothetical protein